MILLLLLRSSVPVTLSCSTAANSACEQHIAHMCYAITGNIVLVAVQWLLTLLLLLLLLLLQYVMCLQTPLSLQLDLCWHRCHLGKVLACSCFLTFRVMHDMQELQGCV